VTVFHCMKIDVESGAEGFPVEVEGIDDLSAKFVREALDIFLNAVLGEYKDRIKEGREQAFKDFVEKNVNIDFEFQMELKTELTEYIMRYAAKGEEESDEGIGEHA